MKVSKVMHQLGISHASTWHFGMCGKFKITCTETFNRLAINETDETDETEFLIYPKFQIFVFLIPLNFIAPGLYVWNDSILR